MLLEPGSTCWRRDQAPRAALIVDMADWDADMKAAGLSGYMRTVGGGPFVLIKQGAAFREIVDSDGDGFVVQGPAELQVGNRNGLLEYRLNSGTAICFSGSTGYCCAVALSDEEMRERRSPASHRQASAPANNRLAARRFIAGSGRGGQISDTTHRHALPSLDVAASGTI